MTLQQVQVLIRHGDRTPIDPIPGTRAPPATWNCNLTFASHAAADGAAAATATRLYNKVYLPGRNSFPGNCMAGQLTARGRAQHETLGASLRDRYVTRLDFLSDADLASGGVWARTTDVPRTIMSAQSLLAGLFPEAAAAAADAGTPLVTLHTMEGEGENMTPNTGRCPRLDAIAAAAMATPHYHAVLGRYNATLQRVMAALGVPAPYSPRTIAHAYDGSTCRFCHGKPLPSGVSEADVEAMRALGGWYTGFIFNSTEGRRLSMGTLVGELLDRMKAGAAGTGPKFLLYSGHDTTVQPLLTTLGAPDAFAAVLPPYASHIEIELWRDANGAFFVASSSNGRPVPLAGCASALCPLDTFVHGAQQVVPVNYAAECAVKQVQPHPRLRASADA